ncbi:uncharacterized protein G2W53_003845 [Senna tora]|uniref:Uncharacterized protein n=1 Tax=Senna tora TaxID=362788 RepID=A0A835CJM5_9FABA|nr:uncharacterized protein G2W53_003845 [Senna tora]
MGLATQRIPFISSIEQLEAPTVLEGVKMVCEMSCTKVMVEGYRLQPYSWLLGNLGVQGIAIPIGNSYLHRGVPVSLRTHGRLLE